MKRLVHQIVRRLRHPQAPLSRNRHFATFQSQEGYRALEIHREIASLEADLARAEPSGIRVVRNGHPGTVRVELTVPALRLTRAATLSREELDILLESPTVGALLRDAEWVDIVPPE